jgi:hypothetical protein
MMQSKHKDLWGDIEEVTELLPRDLMQQQATILGQKTKNLLKGEIVSYPVETLGIDVDAITAKNLANVVRSKKITVIQQTFYLYVPSLQYRYELFSVRHDITGYPVEVGTDGDDIAYHVLGLKPKADKNEEEFTETLMKILSSERTKKIVSSLLSQARGSGRKS